MSSWEFLLQQEGDNDWLPLEAPVVEILEGRYRLIARCPAGNTSAWVEVTFRDEALDWSGLDFSPISLEQQAHQQSWECRTSSEGLLLILPFSYLKPGCWEVHCQLSPTEVALPVSHPQVLCLDVLPTESNVKEPWSNLDLFGEHSANVTTECSPESLIQETSSDPMSDRLVTAPEDWYTAFSDRVSCEDDTCEDHYTPVTYSNLSFDLLTREADSPGSPAANLAVESPQTTPPPEIPVTSGPIPSALFYLTLEQEYLASHHQGESVWLIGAIAVEALAAEPLDRICCPLELQVTLRHPFTKTVILEVSQAVESEVIPISFACELAIPVDYEPHLLLGDVTLYASATRSQDRIRLGNQPFSIATNVDTVFKTNWPRTLRSLTASDLEPADPEHVEAADLDDLEVVPLDALDLSSLSAQDFQLQVDPRELEVSSEQGLPPTLWNPSDDLATLAQSAFDAVGVQADLADETEASHVALELLLTDAIANADVNPAEISTPAEDMPLVIHPTESMSSSPPAHELQLDFFQLVKQPIQPLSSSRLSHRGWRVPPNLQPLDAQPRMVSDHQGLRLPLFPPEAWEDLSANPMSLPTHTPISAAQILTRLLQASQSDDSSPSAAPHHGGRAAKLQQFHDKLTGLSCHRSGSTPNPRQSE